MNYWLYIPDTKTSVIIYSYIECGANRSIRVQSASTVDMMADNSTYSRSTIAIGLVDFILIPAYVLVIVIGFGGNILVLLVVKRKRSMHTTTNYLLANLAVADLLTLLWCIPGMVMTFVLHPQGTLGDFLCKFVTMHHIAGITQLVSGLTLTVLAVERYKALFHPLSVRLRLTRKNVKYPIVCMWLFSIVYVIPLFVAEKYSLELQTCQISWDADIISSIVYWGILALIVFISFVIMSFCYFNIINGLYFTKTICSRGSTGSSASSQCGIGTDNAEQAEKRKIVKLLLSVTVVFFVCFLPFCVASVVILDTRYVVVYKLSYFLVYCSSSLNPFIYAFHSSNYREAFNTILLNITKTFHCELPKRWRGFRCSNKMSDFELKATYHPTNELPPSQQQPRQNQEHQLTLLTFKTIEKG